MSLLSLSFIPQTYAGPLSAHSFALLQLAGKLPHKSAQPARARRARVLLPVSPIGGRTEGFQVQRVVSPVDSVFLNVVTGLLPGLSSRQSQ